MAHFYGSMQGARGKTTRCGNKGSGIMAHVRGWDFGVMIQCDYHPVKGDVVTIRLTSGSNGHSGDLSIGPLCAADFERLKGFQADWRDFIDNDEADEIDLEIAHQKIQSEVLKK